MCTNNALVERLECYIEDIVDCFEDFVKRSLCMLALGVCTLIAMSFLMVKKLMERSAVTGSIYDNQDEAMNQMLYCNMNAGSRGNMAAENNMSYCASDCNMMNQGATINQRAYPTSYTSDTTGNLQASTPLQKSTANQSRPQKSEMFRSQKSEMFGPQASEVFKPQKSEMFRPQKSEMLRPQISEMLRSEASEMFGPQASEVFKPQKSEMFRPQKSEMLRPQKSEMFKSQKSEMFGPQASTGYRSQATLEGPRPQPLAGCRPQASEGPRQQAMAGCRHQAESEGSRPQASVRCCRPQAASEGSQPPASEECRSQTPPAGCRKQVSEVPKPQASESCRPISTPCLKGQESKAIQHDCCLNEKKTPCVESILPKCSICEEEELNEIKLTDCSCSKTASRASQNICPNSMGRITIPSLTPCFRRHVPHKQCTPSLKPSSSSSLCCHKEKKCNCSSNP